MITIKKLIFSGLSVCIFLAATGQESVSDVGKILKKKETKKTEMVKFYTTARLSSNEIIVDGILE